MNNEKINKILQDVYAVDKSLEEHEDKLKKIIKRLLESRPNTKFNKDFVRRLRAELMARAAELKKQPQNSLINLISNFTLMKKTYYAIGAVVFIALLVIPTMYYFNKGGKLAELAKTKLAYETSITKVADKAFGSIYTESAALSQADGMGAAEESALVGSGGGQELEGKGAVGTATGEARMIAPQRINYNYIYAGDEFGITEEQMAVYKRIKSDRAGKELAKSIANIDLGLLDLSKFKNTAISNLNLVEDSQFGYSIYFNLADNSISLYTNWNKWPQPYEECGDLSAPQAQDCRNNLRLKIEDVPTDEKLIAIADEFIENYNIDMENYGQPEVLDYWKQNYERAVDKKLAYIPESMQVVYPLIIDNKTVYDESGSKNGLTAEVNIRYNRVAGLRNIVAQSYQSSNYEIETDSQEIIAFAENGGMHRNYQPADPTATVDIKLGAPTLSLIRTWQPVEDQKQRTELYVPAYIFPITNVSDKTYFYRKNIVVPLIKEMLEQAQDDIIGIRELPVPIAE